MKPGIPNTKPKNIFRQIYHRKFKTQRTKFSVLFHPSRSVSNIHFCFPEKKDNVLSHSEGADLKFSDVKIHH